MTTAQKPDVESCIVALVKALQSEKAWLHDYADAVIRDAIDRRVDASLLAKEAECEALRERLAFLTQPGALRFVEEESGMYRAYEDKAPADAEQHFWQSMTTLYYPSAAEAIDAARAAADQGGAS